MASTVILGSGIIGLSTAFYLAKHQPGSSIHLVDSSPRLFASASGYAGGFIAKDWFHPDVASLGELSFYEHKKLAEKEGGYDKWGYTRTISVNYEPKSGRWGGREQGRQGVANRADVVQGKRRELEEREEIPPWLNWEAGETVSLIDDGEGAAIM
jgi:glycine/D-amino acid oxidase-like deaminating enzyme